MTERASPSPESRCEAIGRLFVGAILSLCKSCLAASLPSQALRASSPKGGALGRPGHFLLPARGSTGRKRAGAATEGSGFWTSAPCQAAVSPDSGALPFPRHRALLVQYRPDRPAKASPSGRGVCAADGEGASISTTYNENMNKNSKKPYRSKFRSAIIFYACYKNLK